MFKNLYLGLMMSVSSLWGQTIYVSPNGNDSWSGTENMPVLSITRAQEIARDYPKDVSVEIILEDGIYYLPSTIRFTTDDSKVYPATVTYKARNRGMAVVSGGTRLDLQWRKDNDGIYVANISGELDIDQLYVNGIRRQMARFPNSVDDYNRNVYDTWILKHKVTKDPEMDPLSKERILRWKNPEGGYVHAMHNVLWGDMHWYIHGKYDKSTLNLEGGWQNNRPSEMHPVYRIVENIREELDVPGEWFYDRNKKKLYYMPLKDEDMSAVKIEVVRLKHLIEINGTQSEPVSGICFQGLVFKHTSRTFMENKEPLLRSDWTVYRGGVIMFNGAENCSVRSCEFDHVGGNTIFINNYNRYIEIRDCYIHHSGANGIAFVGDPKMVRSPLFRYSTQDYNSIDKIPGPLGNNYPQDCVVDNCLITMTGRDEKQTAPIQISMSQRIRVSHCSIYDVPRAGININEGTFGGHIIEFCDVFNTVLETGDHGSFNSWGRDRFWSSDAIKMSDTVGENPNMPYWDIMEPNILRYNRFRCDHGWDIDLDDGSSFYRIYCNVLLNGGLKMREGYDRIATNNIIINNSLHPHVWLRGSKNVFKHNIVFDAYKPAAMQRFLGKSERWGEDIDYNLFVSSISSVRKFAANGADMNSIAGDPMFVCPETGDYSVKHNSPAFEIGYHNFSMNDFGVRSEWLKEIAKKPEFPKLTLNLKEKSVKTDRWMGAILSEVSGEELSAYGFGFGETAVALEYVPEESEARKMGFMSGDLIVNFNKRGVPSIALFNEFVDKNRGMVCKVVIIRNQKEEVVSLLL